MCTAGYLFLQSYIVETLNKLRGVVISVFHCDRHGNIAAVFLNALCFFCDGLKRINDYRQYCGLEVFFSLPRNSGFANVTYNQSTRKECFCSHHNTVTFLFFTVQPTTHSNYTSMWINRKTFFTAPQRIRKRSIVSLHRKTENLLVKHT